MRRALVAAAIALGLTSAASAGPNPPKFTRSPTVIVRQDDADRARLAPAPVAAREAAPALGGDEILRLYGLTAGLREDRVMLLEQLIADTPDREVDEKAELWFRLAEARAEQWRYHRLTGDAARAKRSVARFDAWVKAKRAAGEVASRAYQALVADVKVPAQAIAAAARLGQIPQQLADALFTAEIPRSVRTGANADDTIEAYCDAVTDLTGPLEDAAVTAYGACLKASTRLGWSSDWSRLCERELGQIRPDEYPTATELRSAPRASAAAPVLEAALRL